MSILSEPYQRVGLKRVINAATCLTSIGGSIPDPKVFEEMEHASNGFVQIHELQKAVGNRIAQLFNVEAGLPTAGAVNALIIAVAACMFKGTELEKHDPLGPITWTKIIQKLPLHTEDLKNEFILLGNSRSEYDHAIECAGGRRVQAGSKDGVTLDDIRNVFTEKTAALYYTVTPTADMPISEFCSLAKELGVPAIVDVAPFLTHADIPSKIINDGADLVIFSGGKQLGSINNTGLLLGRSELIKLAHLNSYPFDGIARGSKMSREVIMGLLTTVELFTEKDRNEYYKEQHSSSLEFSGKLGQLEGVRSGVMFEPSILKDAVAPSLIWIELKDSSKPLRKVYEELLHGEPSIRTLYEPFFLVKDAANRITFKVEYLIPGDQEIILDRLSDILSH